MADPIRRAYPIKSTLLNRKTPVIVTACAAALLIVLAGVSGILAQSSGGVTLPYTGHLTDEAGKAVPDGVYALTFALYDTQAGGNLLWSETQNSVTVQDGSFATLLGSVNPLPALAKEARLWVEISVRGPDENTFTTLTPRLALEASQATQALSSASVSLLAGSSSGPTCAHTHFGQFWQGDSSLTGIYSGLKVQDVYTNGTGLFGEADTGNSAWGVGGISTDGTGVYGSSTAGKGVAGSSNTGQGVYGGSASSQGVYGQSGAADGVLGTTGAVGMSGVYGYSNTGFGVTGRTWSTSTVHSAVQGVDSGNGYGGYFHADNYRGLYASGGPNWYAGYFDDPSGPSSPGLYVNGYASVSGDLNVSGNLFVFGSKLGYVVDLALNDGPEPLETGDVVVISGYGDPVIGQIPLVKVRKAAQAGSKAVMGVVDQPYALSTSVSGQEEQVPLKPSSATALAAAGTGIGQGQYLSVVTLGAFKAVKVDASAQPVQTGDLLVASANPGYATASDDPKLGSVIGKALGECKSGTCVLPVMVTLK